MRNDRRDPDKRDPPERYYLDGLLPADKRKSPYFGKGACSRADLREVPALYCQTYTIDGEERLTDVIADIKETAVKFDRWVKVEEAVQALKKALGRLPGDSPLRADVAELLLRTREPLSDEKTTELIAVLAAEARFAIIYRHVYYRFKDQDADWQKEHQNVHPDREVEELAEKDVWERTENDIATITRKLLEKAELMRHPSRIPRDDAGVDVLTVHVTTFAGDLSPEQLRMALSRIERAELEATRDVEAPMRPDTRTPREIYAEVRRWDWFVFVVATALTALVYLSGKYGSEWGSLDDYVFAFAAGAITPAAASWALLPFTRSYNALAGKLVGRTATSDGDAAQPGGDGGAAKA